MRSQNMNFLKMLIRLSKRPGLQSFRLWLAHVLDKIDTATGHIGRLGFCDLIVRIWPNLDEPCPCDWCESFRDGGIGGKPGYQDFDG